MHTPQKALSQRVAAAKTAAQSPSASIAVESAVDTPKATGPLIRPVNFVDYGSSRGGAQKLKDTPQLKGTPHPKDTPRRLTIDGVEYELLPSSSKSAPEESYGPPAHSVAFQAIAEVDSEEESITSMQTIAPEEILPINLPSVLAAIDGSHPIVGISRWRVQQAYAQLSQARALWLPSIQAGLSFHRHDGNYQASNGDIVDVNRNSFQYGLGAGATGAGTTMPRPGIVAQFHLADAIFQPKRAQKAAWARGHAARATLNKQLLSAASAYIDLVGKHQSLEIRTAALNRLEELSRITNDYAETGQGLKADADRMSTELALAESQQVAAQQHIEEASAVLAQAISLDSEAALVPMDLNAVPLNLGGDQPTDGGTLIATALASRPELKECQTLVAAACEAYKREKYSACVPSVLLGFSTGGFGGGLGSNLANIDDRYDFDAMLTWQTRNLGFGERAARREKSAQVQQAKFEKIRVMDDVARQVRSALAKSKSASRQMQITQAAISRAEDSHRRNLERIRDGLGLPLEALQSIKALEATQGAYSQAVSEYNLAQIELQWAMGFPIQ
ncbi:MAG TPA: TolC family protein [Planctomycetaceae bacterium]|nr:TolC family protein [Planctomycetaceae bacterium]